MKRRSKVMQRAMGGGAYVRDSEFSSGPGAIAAVDGASPARRNLRKQLQARSMMRDRALAGLGATQQAMTGKLLGAGSYTTKTPIAVGPPVYRPVLGGRGMNPIAVSSLTGRPTGTTVILDPTSMYGNQPTMPGPGPGPLPPPSVAIPTTTPTSSAGGSSLDPTAAGGDAGIPATPTGPVTLTPPATLPDDGSDTDGLDTSATGTTGIPTWALVGGAAVALYLLLKK